MPKIEMEDHSEECLNAKDKQMLAAMTKIAAKCEKYAKADCPVRTGNLRNSINNAAYKMNDWRGEQHVAVVGTNVEYAPYVENGARGRQPKHFLKKSVSEHNSEYYSIIEKMMKGS